MVFFISFALLSILGCTSNDRIGAGREGNLNTPNTPAATNAIPADSRAQSSGQPDPAATGGSTLPASAPYEGGGATVTQNVNPAPFLVASQPGAGGTGAAPSNALTSRADGTMRGPNDLPAASTGSGTSGQPTAAKPAVGKQNRSRKK
jgi:hypothetical protein